jgi:general secretion pathway protein F
VSRYRYRAATAQGRIKAGVLAAASPAEADELLVQRGLQPLLLEPVRSGPGPGRRIRHRDLVTAIRSVATLVSVGVPIERALATTARLPVAQALKESLAEARRLLAEGRPLAAALEEARLPLGGPHLGVLRAGERGSRLGPALDALADTLEQEGELRSRVRQALAYPSVLLMAGLASICVIAGIIVPRFAEILADLDAALPLTTRALLATSGFVTRHGWLLLLGAGVAAVAAERWSVTPGGMKALSQLALRLPLVGAIRHQLATARAALALGTLLGSGAPMLSALAAAREANGDVTIGERLERARDRVFRGEPLAAALEAEQAFPEAPLQLVAVGESTGHLAEMARRAGELAAREAEGRLRALVSLIEPLLVLAIGGFVAFVALALLQAVYSLRPVG